MHAGKTYKQSLFFIIMDRETITVVTGLPRTGTSMMMKMLDAGGIPPLTDKIRKPNEDNPKGYYEYERVKKLPDDIDWVSLAKGKAVKVLAELVKHLPDTHRYKVIFMERNLDEMLESQRKMLIRRGKDPDEVSDAELKEMFIQYRNMVRDHVESHPTMEVLYVGYNELLLDPEVSVKKIDSFFDGKLDTEKMISVIDPELYRNRA